MVAALRDEGIAAEARGHPFTGVWAGERKIGSIGVHVSRGVTTHGLAVNVDNDLQPFEWIVPCGIDHVRMTSVSRETGRSPGLPCFRRRLAHRLAEAAGRRQRLVSRAPAPERGPGAGAERRMSTRSRSNPGGARVLDMGEVLPVRRAQAGVVQAPGARERRATASSAG